MFIHAIDKETKRVFEKIASSELASMFYLAGGTALAIELGHRESIDLDWFTQTDFDVQTVKEILSELGGFMLTGESRGTIHGLLDGVKVSFFHYKYPLLFPFVKFEEISLADERDIAAMKIDAISSRGSKKDFVDLFFLLKKYSLTELIDFFTDKYKGIEYNLLHILKSLSFFEDADSDPEPIMLVVAKWEEVKNEITRQVHKNIG